MLNIPVSNELKFTNSILIKDNFKLDNFINKFQLNNSIFVFDFDWTITKKWKYNSFSPIDFSPNDTNWDMEKIKNYYLPIEQSRWYDDLKNHLSEKDKNLILNNNLSFSDFYEQKMNEWWKLTMDYAIEYWVNISHMEDFFKEVTFRDSMKELIKKLLEKNIDVMIVSAWVKNFIDNFMQLNWFDLSNNKLHILWNEFIVDNNWNFKDYNKWNLITCLTKKHIDYEKYWVNHKDFAVQFWDSIWDFHMVNDHFDENKILTIWFTNWDEKKKWLFSETFDLTYTGNNDWVTNLIKFFNI